MPRSDSIVMSFAVLFAGATARAGVIVDLGHPTKTPIFGDHPGRALSVNTRQDESSTAALGT